MSITDGVRANAANFNAAFVSRTAATTSTTAQTTFSNTTQSTDKDTGAIITEGGLGVEKNINAGGTIKNADTTQSTTKDTGSIVTEGGIGVEKNLNVGGDVTAAGAITATGNMLANNLSGTNTGDVTLSAIGSTPNANASSLAGQVLNLQPANASFGGVVSTTTQSFAGDKTFTGNVVVSGNLDINGTTTTVNTATLNVTDTNITINKGGNDASSEGSGITVDRTGTKGSIVYANALTSKFKIGDLASESEVITAAGAQTISAIKTFSATPLLKTALDIEDPGAGTNKITIQAPTLAASYTLTMPVDDGTSNQVLKTDGSGVLSWTTPSVGSTSPLTTKGDVWGYSSVDARVPIGTNNYLLMADSAQTLGLKWAPIDLTTSSISGVLPIANGGTNNGSLAVTAGGVVLTDGSKLTNSGAGTQGQVLTSNVAGAATFTTLPVSPDTAENYSLSQATNAGAHTWAFTLKDAVNGALSSTNFTKLTFRNDGGNAATSTVTTYSAVTVTSGITITIPSGATMGHQNAIEHIVYVLAINNSGTAELAVTSTLPAIDTMISSTTIDSTSDSATGIYSTTGRSNVAWKLLGYFNSTQTTAGTWDTAPTSNAGSVKSLYKPPTTTIYLSGNNTYTPPLGLSYIKVMAIGGGGGGGPSGTSGTGGTPTSGGNTVFGTSLIQANGGSASGSTAGSTASGGSGGGFSISAPAVQAIGSETGSDGNVNIYGPTTIASGGGMGGGPGAGGASEAGAGSAGKANTGGGGSGGGTSAGVSAYPGTGGGKGGIAVAIIPNPGRTSYTANVGAGGTGGTLGTSGFAGGNGGSGVIIIEEYYQ